MSREAEALSAFREQVGPIMAGGMRATVERGVEMGVAFAVQCVEQAAAEYRANGEPALAEALAATAEAVQESAAIMLAESRERGQ